MAQVLESKYSAISKSSDRHTARLVGVISPAVLKLVVHDARGDGDGEVGHARVFGGLGLG